MDYPCANVRHVARLRQSPHVKDVMRCPVCSAEMNDITESWHTYAEATGAEYLSAYVTIWHCPACNTLAGGEDDMVEWVMEREEALAEE
jgi:uncharacterized protein with PIN domain